VTVFIPDVSNDNWGSEDLTPDGQQKLMEFLRSLPGGYAGVEHKMSQGADFIDPYGAIAQRWCANVKFPFIGYHYATTDDPAAQIQNWKSAGGGGNVMIDFEQGDATVSQFWDLVTAFNSAAVNVALAYVPQWFADDIGMDLTPLAGNAIALVSSAYPLGYSQGEPADLYRGCGGDTGEGWASYRGGVPVLWQFTSSARIGGIIADCNAYHGTAQQLGDLFAV
jgi:hypothetical protein